MCPLIIGIINIMKIFILTGVTKVLLDVSSEKKKHFFLRVKIDSSNFSTVSCLGKTLTHLGLSFSICEM